MAKVRKKRRDQIQSFYAHNMGDIKRNSQRGGYTLATMKNGETRIIDFTPDRAIPDGFQGQRIGKSRGPRNAPCPCGSMRPNGLHKKFKQCCGTAPTPEDC